MLGVRKILNRRFARLSPVFVALGIAVAGVCGNPAASFAKAAEGDTSTTSAVKREAAGAQFARAEEQRATLNSKPPEKRTLAEYKTVVASYRRVYLITPRACGSGGFPAVRRRTLHGDGGSLRAELLPVGGRFLPFLVHEYPGSKYSQDALLRIGKLQRDQLGDSALAHEDLRRFLEEVSAFAAQARGAGRTGGVGAAAAQRCARACGKCSDEPARNVPPTPAATATHQRRK